MLKNITLKAEEELIHKAKEKAQHDHTTLSAIFRRWLIHYVGHEENKSTDYKTLMKELSYVSVGRTFNRDEMNER